MAFRGPSQSEIEAKMRAAQQAKQAVPHGEYRDPNCGLDTCSDVEREVPVADRPRLEVLAQEHFYTIAEARNLVERLRLLERRLSVEPTKDPAPSGSGVAGQPRRVPLGIILSATHSLGQQLLGELHDVVMKLESHA